VVFELLSKEEQDAPPSIDDGHPTRTGNEIDEKDIVEEKLGKGGMSTVWAVRHKMLGSRYALKVLTNRDTRID